MSAECERVFSSTKKLITPERNRLTEDIIEASECLKNWWDHGLIVQQPYTQRTMVPTIARWKMRVGAVWAFLGSLFRLCHNNIMLHVLGQDG